MRIHMSEATFKLVSKFKGYYLSDRGPMEVFVSTKVACLQWTLIIMILWR